MTPATANLAITLISQHAEQMRIARQLAQQQLGPNSLQAITYESEFNRAVNALHELQGALDYASQG